jgi:hypothetical protein
VVACRRTVSGIVNLHVMTICRHST